MGVNRRSEGGATFALALEIQWQEARLNRNDRLNNEYIMSLYRELLTRSLSFNKRRKREDNG
jgi:hypothetical protein